MFRNEAGKADHWILVSRNSGRECTGRRNLCCSFRHGTLCVSRFEKPRLGISGLCRSKKKTLHDDSGHGTHVAGILAGDSNISRGYGGGCLCESNILSELLIFRGSKTEFGKKPEKMDKYGIQ